MLSCEQSYKVLNNPITIKGDPCYLVTQLYPLGSWQFSFVIMGNFLSTVIDIEKNVINYLFAYKFCLKFWFSI
ncbi:hypothetical protein JHK86_033372 [Glycine max]|nr:hypothetical protein JHK86_033372 [Glycine max]